MKTRSILISIMILFPFLYLPMSVHAQNKEVKVTFEVDGKLVRQKFKVLFDVNGKIVEAKLTKKGFYVPSELLSCRECEIFAVRFTSKKYILAFDSVYQANLNSDWSLGIDNKPFDADNMNSSQSYENVRTLHYLSFRPTDNGIATRITVPYSSVDLK